MSASPIQTGAVIACSSDEEYYNLIESAADHLVVVDCYADWCGPCRTMAPVFESLATQYPDAVFIKINVERLPNISKALGVWAMPTFYFLKHGNKVGSVMGANERRLRQGLDNDGKVSSICSSMPCTIQ